LKKAPLSADPQSKPWPPGSEDLVVHELVLKKMRHTVDMVETWDLCGRPACRRSRRCRDREVRCFDEFAEAIRGTLQELVDWERFDGPLSEARHAGIAARIREAMDRGES
jgi:hypothetical protein